MKIQIKDILLYIFLYLEMKDLGKVSLVCKQFCKLSNENNLWKNLYVNKYYLHNHKLLPNPYKSWKVYLKNRLNIKDKLNNVFKKNYKIITKHNKCVCCYLEDKYQKLDLEWINWDINSKCDIHKGKIIFNDINQETLMRCGKKMINDKYYIVSVTYYDGIHKILFNAWDIEESHPCTLLISLNGCD